MPTCPGCGIERKDLSTACAICGTKPAPTATTPPPLPASHAAPGGALAVPAFMGDIDEDARALIGDGIIERMPTAEEKRQIIEAGLQVGGLEYTLRGVIEEYLPGLLTADESLFVAEGRAIDDAYHKKQRGNKKPPATKACPACAEQILFAAAKCKHCGHVMGSVIGGIAAPAPTPARRPR